MPHDAWLQLAWWRDGANDDDDAPSVGLESTEDVTGERGCCIEGEEEGYDGGTVAANSESRGCVSNGPGAQGEQ